MLGSKHRLEVVALEDGKVWLGLVADACEYACVGVGVCVYVRERDTHTLSPSLSTHLVLDAKVREDAEFVLEDAKLHALEARGCLEERPELAEARRGHRVQQQDLPCEHLEIARHCVSGDGSV